MNERKREKGTEGKKIKEGKRINKIKKQTRKEYIYRNNISKLKIMPLFISVSFFCYDKNTFRIFVFWDVTPCCMADSLWKICL
jgi:ribosomal protein S19